MKKVMVMLIAVLLMSLTANAQNPVKYKNGWNDKNISFIIGSWEGRSNKSWTGFIPIMGINTMNEVRMYFQNKTYKTSAVKRNKKGTKFIVMMVDNSGSVAEMTMKKEKDCEFYYIEFVDAKESLVFYARKESTF
jgi:hypothetical protein